jgi:hypothetical protein
VSPGAKTRLTVKRMRHGVNDALCLPKMNRRCVLNERDALGLAFGGGVKVV